MIELTAPEARRYMLYRSGLLGERRFSGKAGALDFVRQAGCIQFDPVDICGRNAELTLNARVSGFSGKMLRELLYTDRSLVDYPDKNLSIIPAADWPYFERYRSAARACGAGFEGLADLERQALAYIREHGPVSADTLPIDGRINWHSAIHWSGNWHGESRASRSVLEQLYSTGELVIHHKEGARKFYDLAERHLPAGLLAAPDPLPGEVEHMSWRVLRRIGAVGLLWNRPSDAWLNIGGLNASARGEVFNTLLSGGLISECHVEGIRPPLYMLSADLPLLNSLLSGDAGQARPRCELLAPLDPLLWDRRLIRELFGFDYTWELYVPAEKRRYSAYALPVLWGERFAGRLSASADRTRGVLTVHRIWYESGVRRTKKLQAALDSALRRLARLNGCSSVEYENPGI